MDIAASAKTILSGQMRTLGLGQPCYVLDQARLVRRGHDSHLTIVRKFDCHRDSLAAHSVCTATRGLRKSKDRWWSPPELEAAQSATTPSPSMQMCTNLDRISRSDE